MTLTAARDSAAAWGAHGRSIALNAHLHAETAKGSECTNVLHITSDDDDDHDDHDHHNDYGDDIHFHKMTLEKSFSSQTMLL